MGLYFNIALFLPFNKIENKEVNVFGTILESDFSNEYYNRYLVKIRKNKDFFVNFNCYVNTTKDIKYENGDFIEITGIYTRGNTSRNYKGFDYREYLMQRKIFGIIEAKLCNKIKNNFDIEIFFYKIKGNILSKIDNIYENNETKELLKCILVGRGLEDNIIKENFKNSNLSHVLAISGMHVSYIILGTNLIKIPNKKYSLILKFILLNFYLILTGISVSCLRACLMYNFIIISKLIYRKNNIYVTALNTLIISILYNIYNISNAGMWLSYGGMLGIVLFNKFIYKILIFKYKIRNKIICKIIEISCISISAQIFIFPIMMYFFNTISLNFLISNLAIYYLIGPIIILGYLIIIFSFFKENFLFKIISNFENIIVQLLIKITDIISKYFNFNIYTITPNIITVILYFLAIIFIIIIFNKCKYKFIKNILIINIKYIINNLKNMLNIKKFYSRLIIIIVIFNIFINANLNFKRDLEISFLDVGQGDCTYIKTPENKHILIDSGEGNGEKYDYGKNVVLPYLLDKRITKLDYIFISHFDSDHVGGIFFILESIKVEKIFIGVQAEEYENYIKLKKVASENKIPIVILKKGDRLKIEKDIYIDILFPDKNKTIIENKINNNSLVFKFYYNKVSVLFTGDIEEVAEREILDNYKDKILKSTILKVAHHGSKSSSIESFIKSVKPKIAIIGVEKDNSYGHPSRIVLKRLKKYEVKVYRTDNNGEINIKINNDGEVKVKTHLKYFE